MRRLYNYLNGKSLKIGNDGNVVLNIDSGKYFQFGAVKIYSFTTAITANTTTTTAAAGSLAMTSNATGAGSIFRSDGSKWQFLTNA